MMEGNAVASAYDEKLDRSAFDRKAMQLLNRLDTGGKETVSESPAPSGETQAHSPKNQVAEAPSALVGSTTPKGKEKKRVSYIPESESSATADEPSAVGSGLFGSKIAEPLSSISAGSINPLTKQSYLDQIRIESLTKAVEELRGMVDALASDSRVHEKKILELDSTNQSMKAEMASMRASASVLHKRMEEFDSHSLSVVERAAEIIDKITPDEKSLLQDLEQAKEMSKASKVEQQAKKIEIAPKPKQAKKKLFGFNKLT